MDLSLTTNRVGEHLVVSLAGIADLSSAPGMYDHLRRVCADHPAETLLIDIDGLLSLDDAALGLLFGAVARARRGGGDVELICTDDRLLQLLQTTGFDRTVVVRSSIADTGPGAT
jgi:anti-sigma B factor antagonist